MNDLFTRLFRRTKAAEEKVAEVGVRTTALESRPKITASDAFTESTLNSVMRYVTLTRPGINTSSPSISSSSLFSISKSEYEALL